MTFEQVAQQVTLEVVGNDHVFRLAEPKHRLDEGGDVDVLSAATRAAPTDRVEHGVSARVADFAPLRSPALNIPAALHLTKAEPPHTAGEANR